MEAKISARNWTHWFEIPVLDMDRAKRFYDAVFSFQLEVQDFGGFKMAVFPHEDVGAALCFGGHYKPAENGVTVYLDANPDLNLFLERIRREGGRNLQEKKQISESHGFMALFIDSEGNRLALHSMG